MCIIAYKPAGIDMLSDDLIRHLFKKNPDGAGIMYPEAGKVHIQKGFMKVESLLDFLHTAGEANGNWNLVPVVLHFRIGTAGLNDELNCHPYPIGAENAVQGDYDLAMAHNGILYEFNPPKGSKINDTQEFIHEMLDGMKPELLNDPTVRKLITKVASPSRLCFMDGRGNVTMIGNFFEDSGCYYSNEGYKQVTYTTSRWYDYPSYSHYTQSKLFNDDCLTSKKDSPAVLETPDSVSLDYSDYSDGLSFEDKFEQISCDGSTTAYYPTSKRALTSAVREMKSKLEQVDKLAYASNQYFYEVDDDIIYRYNLDDLNEWY